MIKILGHHVDSIKERFCGITDINHARRLVREDEVPRLKKLWHVDGKRTYPNLDANRTIQNLSKMIVAVNTGNFIRIPEVNKNGGYNKDGMCDACGELEIISSFPVCMYNCGLERRTRELF
jgi:hypothetical protein